MIYPLKMEKGFNIGVTATSSGYDDETDYKRLDSAISHFEELGYPVVVTPNVRTSHKGRSSDGRTRAKELMELVMDPEIRVIFAASGGDYLVEMLPFIDFEAMAKNPKWIQGFSDTTTLTFTITTNLDIATMYSYNFGTFGMEHWHHSLLYNTRILEGHDMTQKSFDKYQDGYFERITGLEGFVLEKDVEWKNIISNDNKNKQEITLHGRALGGCLDCLLNLVGTRFDKTKEFIDRYQEDGILWFLESYDLNSEALYRGLWQLKEAGWFNHAVGFIFGRPAMYDSRHEISYEESVCSALKDLNLPIILDADIGHKPPQFTMINGAIATINSIDKNGTIIFERR